MTTSKNSPTKTEQSFKQTQQQILRHHGGDADKARQMITETYSSRFDEAFWQFWQDSMAPVISKGDVLLDLGAGIGQFVKDLAERYPENQSVGVDVVDYMLDAQLVLPENGQIIADDLNNPQAAIDKNSVATIMASLVVHELPQPINLFKAAYDWLKPGGRFCVIDLIRQPLADYLSHKYPQSEVFNQGIARKELEDVFEHFLEHNRYHKEDLLFMLEGVGFKVLFDEVLPNGRMVRLVLEKPAVA